VCIERLLENSSFEDFFDLETSALVVNLLGNFRSAHVADGPVVDADNGLETVHQEFEQVVHILCHVRQPEGGCELEFPIFPLEEREIRNPQLCHGGADGPLQGPFAPGRWVADRSSASQQSKNAMTLLGGGRAPDGAADRGMVWDALINDERINVRDGDELGARGGHL